MYRSNKQNIEIMKTLTLQQLESQIEAINTTRFLLERTYNASESTILEIEKVLKELNEERNSRF